MNDNKLDQDELNREMILDLFYTTKGDLDKINHAIDKKLKIIGSRKITLFEEYVKNRLSINPLVLKMPQMQISTVETIYLSQYPAIKNIEILDLRKNFIGDEGVSAIAKSSFLNKLRELDLRNNGISRLGVKILAGSKSLSCLEKIDLRLNKLGKRWEEKFNEAGNFPKLNQIKTI
jgi:Ran GTPase-activating protein (RanGAP) involved in mRNA processing and transport